MAKKKTSKAAAETFSFPKAAKVRTKSEVYRALAESTGVSRKDVGRLFAALHAMIGQDLNKNGVFALPGLAKVSVIKKAATKARNAPNPFKPGEMMMVKAKPARKVVKVRALKNLKGFVA